MDVTHYDAHNLYGLAEARVTALALDHLRPQARSLVISRSTFPGSGAWGGHWLGDNEASWDDLRASIPGMLTLGLSGVALVGADICGFAGPASRELCIRWTELGALYPFSRNHNTLDTPAQHPSAWDPQVRPRACQHAATQKQAPKPTPHPHPHLHPPRNPHPHPPYAHAGARVDAGGAGAEVSAVAVPVHGLLPRVGLGGAGGAFAYDGVRVALWPADFRCQWEG